MSIHKDGGRWRVSWREGDSQRTRRFDTEEEAQLFDLGHQTPEEIEPEAPQGPEPEVDLVSYLVRREGVPAQVIKRWITEKRIRIDWGETVWVWTRETVPKAFLKNHPNPSLTKDRILVGRQIPSKTLRWQRNLAKKRQKVAADNNVAVGYVDHELKLIQGHRPYRSGDQ